MRRILAVVILFAFRLASVHAQILDPVDWSFRIVSADEKTFEFVAQATMEKGWHVYALQASADPNAIGPISTSLRFEPSPGCTASGKPKEGRYITHFDPNFELDLNYFEGTAEFRQRFARTNAGSFRLKGVVEYMACNDTQCIFPDPEEFDVVVAAAGAPAGQETGAPTADPEATTSSRPGIQDPVQWTVTSESTGNGAYRLVLTARMEPGWHIYAQHLPSDQGPVATAFTFEPAEGISFPGPVKEPRPVRKYDPNFMMDVAYHEGEVRFEQEVRTTRNPAPEVVASVSYMACTEEMCLPPASRHVRIDLSSGRAVWFDPEAGAAADSSSPSGRDPFRIDRANPDSPLSNCGQEKEHYGLWGIFLLGILGGLLALLTPCVFPMIPLTVSFFTKGAGGKHGKRRAALYGIFILLIYFLLSLPFHLSKSVDPEVLNNIATNVWLNLAFFVVFSVFAVSFFGYFEITLPSGLANRVDKGSNLSGSIGIFFMALTLAIVSFSCTGPILGTVIGSIYASEAMGTIQVLGLELSLPAAKVSSAMIGFGISLGLPFGLFAAFPAMLKKLPKSGGWLEDFKVSLGFAEAALAVKFLSNADLVQQWGILKREVFFAIWILIGILWVLYLTGKFRFKPGQGSPRMSTFKLIFTVALAAFTLRLIPGVLSPSEWNRFAFLSGFPPPRAYSLYHYEEEFRIYRSLEEAMAAARKENKPVFLDFTGWACVNCRKMEENVWPVDEVRTLLARDYIMCSLYVDEKVELPAGEQFTYTTADGRVKKIRTVGNKWATLQTETFFNNSQPFYALLAPDSTLLAPTRQYDPDAKDFSAWLSCGLDAFRTSGQTAESEGLD